MPQSTRHHDRLGRRARTRGDAHPTHVPHTRTWVAFNSLMFGLLSSASSASVHTMGSVGAVWSLVADASTPEDPVDVGTAAPPSASAASLADITPTCTAGLC